MSSLSCASWPNASAATPTRTNSCRSYARTAALPAGLLRHRIRDQSVDELCPWSGYTADAEAVAGFTRHVVQSELQNQSGDAAAALARYGVHGQCRTDDRKQIYSEQFSS